MGFRYSELFKKIIHIILFVIIVYIPLSFLIIFKIQKSKKFKKYNCDYTYMIIERLNEIKRLKEIDKWLLVYGRRKTGKTFLVKNFVDYSEYFFIKKDRNILTKDNRSINYDTFREILIRSLSNEETLVVDEFHRLPEEFFDLLHSLDKKGKLILISSTLFLSKNLFSDRSPLLGLFSEININTIAIKDSLSKLKDKKINKKELLELAVLFTEPIAIDYFSGKKSSRETIAEVVLSSLKTIPALVGEIFLEEEREMSSIYEGILRGISIGKDNSGKLSSWMFSKKLIKKDDPSLIQQYLKNLIDFGLIKKIRIYNKKRYKYKISSPLIKIYYYSDEKYNISERNIISKELIPILDEIFPKIIEDKVRETIAEEKGLIETIYESNDLEIDGVLLKFQKPEIVIEVKWQTPKKSEIKNCERKLKKVNATQKVLFVKDKTKIESDLEVWDVNDLLRK